MIDDTYLSWAKADTGFWVANVRGAFAGTIDQSSNGFFIRNGVGEEVGLRATLADAKTALADSGRILPHLSRAGVCR